MAYAAQTISTPHTGSIPSAGPASAGGMGGGSGGGGMRFSGAPTGARGAADGERGRGPSGSAPSGTAGPAAASGGATTGGGVPGGQTPVSAALTQALKADAGRYRWVAATSGSQSAASLELATGGEPVMAIGGFSGEGGQLTLAQFESYVKAGDIHYYIASGGGGGPGGGARLVERHHHLGQGPLQGGDDRRPDAL